MTGNHGCIKTAGLGLLLAFNLYAVPDVARVYYNADAKENDAATELTLGQSMDKSVSEALGSGRVGNIAGVTAHGAYNFFTFPGSVVGFGIGTVGYKLKNSLKATSDILPGIHN